MHPVRPIHRRRRSVEEEGASVFVSTPASSSSGSCRGSATPWNRRHRCRLSWRHHKESDSHGGRQCLGRDGGHLRLRLRRVQREQPEGEVAVARASVYESNQKLEPQSYW